MGYLETGMRVGLSLGLLARLQELAVLGANDTNTTADHEAINSAEAIAEEFDRLMTTQLTKARIYLWVLQVVNTFPWVAEMLK